MTRLTAFAAALLVIGALVWLGWERISPPNLTPPNATAGEAGRTASSAFEYGRGESTREIEAIQRADRHAVPSTTTDSTGSLLLTVVWALDNSPAPDIDVDVRRRGTDRLLEASRGRTNLEGQFLFEGLAPGTVYPGYRRGSAKRGAAIEIVAGHLAQARLELPIGITVTGRVIDGLGVPVANADILLGEVGVTQVLAKSAADGTFVLRGVPTWSNVGARKPGHAPTALRWVRAAEGAEVEVTIVMDQPGGALAGVVFDPHGEPVSGAAVRAGTTDQNGHRLPDGASAMGPQAELLYSDDAGRFEFASVVSGKVPLAIRTRKLAPWHEEVVVDAGARVEVAVYLRPGATLAGTVRDAAGAVIAGADVRAGDYERLANRRTTTAADGSYRLTGLAPGPQVARASDDEHGETEKSLQLVPGEAARWDPVLARGATLRGRVLTSDGKPAAKQRVFAHEDKWGGGQTWIGQDSTNANGEFTLRNFPNDCKLNIELHDGDLFPAAILKGVKPGPDVLIIRLEPPPKARIHGRVVGPDGETLPEVRVSGVRRDASRGQFSTAVDPDDGTFDVGPLPAAFYVMTISAPGFPTLNLERQLAHAESCDMGTLRFERGGYLAAQLIGDAAVIAGKHSMPIYRDGRYVRSIAFDNGSGRSPPLVAGDYQLLIQGAPIAARAVPFSIRVGTDTRVDVPVSGGVTATIACLAPREPRAGAVMVEIHDRARRLVHRGNANWRGESFLAEAVLSPGAYTVSVTRGEQHGSAELLVGDTACAATVQLPPR